MKIENVFMCAEDESVVVTDSEQENCPVCDIIMESAGWFEGVDCE